MLDLVRCLVCRCNMLSTWWTVKWNVTRTRNQTTVASQGTVYSCDSVFPRLSCFPTHAHAFPLGWTLHSNQASLSWSPPAIELWHQTTVASPKGQFNYVTLCQSTQPTLLPHFLHAATQSTLRPGTLATLATSWPSATESWQQNLFLSLRGTV